MLDPVLIERGNRHMLFVIVNAPNIFAILLWFILVILWKNFFGSYTNYRLVRFYEEWGLSSPLDKENNR